MSAVDRGGDIAAPDPYFLIAARNRSVWAFFLAVHSDVDPFVLHLYAALGEKERRLIATRTREALAALKRRGVKLGNPSKRALAQAGRLGAQANVEAANSFARSILPHIQGHQNRGLSLREIAVEFNRSGIRTARGGEWTATQLSMIQRRCGHAGKTSR